MKRAEVHRVILVAAILLVVVATAVVKMKLDERAAATGEASPLARAKVALEEANRAATSEDFASVEAGLNTAATALEEALASQPRGLEILRARLGVARRRAALDEQLGRDTSTRWRAALALAGRHHELVPTDGLARLDRLRVARALLRARPAASDEASRALAAVERTLNTTPPGPPVRAELARLWLDLAQTRQTDAAAIAALDRGLAHAEADDGDAVEATGRLHTALATAVATADRLERPDDAQRFERRLVEVIELEIRLATDPDLPRRALAQHLSQLAGRLGGDAARALYERALKERRRLLEARPGHPETRRDVARALTHLGALHASADRSEAAIQAYREAAEVAEPLEGKLRRTRLIALGFLAHLLGKQHHMVASKKASADAYALALLLVDPEDRRSQVDAAAAGLRHARLLRAKPRPSRRESKRVARLEHARLATLSGSRADSLRKALRQLTRELR